MTEAYKWWKEYREGREAAQRGDNTTKNPYYSVDSSNEDMKRGYHWRNGWWDAMHDMMKEQTNDPSNM